MSLGDESTKNLAVEYLLRKVAIVAGCGPDLQSAGFVPEETGLGESLGVRFGLSLGFSGR